MGARTLSLRGPGGAVGEGEVSRRSGAGGCMQAPTDLCLALCCTLGIHCGMEGHAVHGAGLGEGGEGAGETGEGNEPLWRDRVLSHDWTEPVEGHFIRSDKVLLFK